MSLIHHYTNIDTLALILENRTIRFNRLDRVDDVSESQECAGIKFGQYFFVSCWTTSEQESIPLWHIYTNSMSGIRISFPKYPFKLSKLTPPPEYRMEQEGEILSPIPFDRIFTDDYFIFTLFLNKNQFCGDINYVNDIEGEYKRSINFSINENGHPKLKISNIDRLARLKKKEWAFQNEYRFMLFIVPSIPIPSKGVGDQSYVTKISDHVMNCFVNGVPPKINYFDIELDKTALDNIVITLGPLCSDGNRIITETLISKYCKNGKVLPSKLTGTIRKPL